MMLVMASLPDNDRIAGPFLAVAGQIDFPADFPVINPAAVRIRLERLGVPTTLAPPAVSVIDETAEDFTCRLAIPAQLGDRIWVLSDLPPERLRAHVLNGAVRTPTLEGDAVEFQAQIQEIRREGLRAISVPVGEAGIELPAATDRAGSVAVWSADGTRLETGRPASLLDEAVAGGAAALAALQQIKDLALGAPDAPSILNKVDKVDLASGAGLDLVGDGTDIILGSAAARLDVPQGNPYQTTLTKLSMKLYGDDPLISGQPVRGFAFMSGVDNRGQEGEDNISGDLVAGYFGATGSPYTTGDANTVRQPIWAINGLTEMRAGSGTYNARVAEFDFNNGLRNIGAGDGAGFTSEVLACGVEAFNSGFHSTAGFLANVGSDGSLPYYRGFAVAPGAAAQAGFADYSNASYSFDSRGNHAFGLYLEGVYSEAAIRVPNGAKIAGKTSGGQTGSMIRLNGSNQIVFGEAGVVTDAVSECSIFPTSDNAKQLGAGGARWSSVWAANGAIQTSDPDLKSDILPVEAHDFSAAIDAVSPISWIWTSGGAVAEEVDDVEMVQAVEIEDAEETYVEMIDGQAIQLTRAVQRERRLFDEILVVDETGAPVMEKRRVFEYEADGSIKKKIVQVAKRDAGGHVILDEQGQPVTEPTEVPVVAMADRQKTMTVPRMVEAPCKRVVHVDRPGQRRHWGFDASEIATVKDVLGADFGGYVQDEDGTQHIRPDQLIPLLWAEVKSLRRRMASVEAGGAG